MRKRQKIIISAGILSIGFLLIKFFGTDYRFESIFGLSVLSLVLSVWSLKEGLFGISWLMVLVLPVMFTIGFGLFYLLLPSVWFEKFMFFLLPDLIVRAFFRVIPLSLIQTGIELMGFGFGVYFLLLTQNILTVATIKTIQLLRSAHAVGFVLTIASAFFAYDAIWSSRYSFWINSLLVGGVTFLLSLQSLWSIKLSEKMTRGVLTLALAIAWVSMQIAAALSFWPVAISTGGLFLATCLYVLLGLCQNYLDDRLHKSAIKEFLLIGAVVFVTTYLTTSWG